MNSSSTLDNNIPQDKQEQVKKMKLHKRIISTAEKCDKKFVTVYEDEGSMVKYCSKKIAKIMEDKRVPDSTGYNSIQSIVNTFDSFFYSSMDPETEILQCDGNFDLFDEDKEVPSLYGISCEIDTFTVWINFLRGFQTIWEGRYNHDLCPFYPKQDSCFFCLMRSLYTRLNKRGKTGPRSLKPFEAAYLLGQMEKSGFNWRSNMKTSSKLLIEETINHISNQADFFKKSFESLNLNCYSCGILRDNIEERITDIDTSTLSYPVSMAEIFYKCIRIRNECSCRNERIIAEDKQKIIMISFSNPINIEIPQELGQFGTTWKYISHVQENSDTETSYFGHNGKMMFQDKDGKIKEDSFGLHLRVKMIAFESSPNDKHQVILEPAYDEKIQKYLRKQYDSVVNPEINVQKQEKTKLYEQMRGKDEKRLAEKRKHDQVRDKD